MQLGSFIPLLIGPADAPLAPWSPWIPRSSLRPRPRSVICTPNSVILFGLPLYSILQPTIPLAGSARAHLSTFTQELRSDLHLRTICSYLRNLLRLPLYSILQPTIPLYWLLRTLKSGLTFAPLHRPPANLHLCTVSSPLAPTLLPISGQSKPSRPNKPYLIIFPGALRRPFY